MRYDCDGMDSCLILGCIIGKYIVVTGRIITAGLRKIIATAPISLFKPLPNSSQSTISPWFSPTIPHMLLLRFCTSITHNLMILNNLAHASQIAQFLLIATIVLTCASFFLVVIGRDLEYFSQAGFDMDRIQIKHNASPALLYEDAIRNEGAIISSSGALINFSGKKTGRSPKDKRIVFEETSKDDIWWGSVNIKMDERSSQFVLIVLWHVIDSPA